MSSRMMFTRLLFAVSFLFARFHHTHLLIFVQQYARLGGGNVVEAFNVNSRERYGAARRLEQK